MESPENLAGFSHCPNPHWFLQPEVMGLYFPSAGTMDCVVCPGAGIVCSAGVLPGFYLPHMNVGLPISLARPSLPHSCHTMSSPPQLSISALPAHLDEYGFFKSLVVGLLCSSIFWQFWVFFVLRLVVILLMVM